MDAPDLNQRLSHISTLWTMVLNAHGNLADAATAAQRALMESMIGSSRPAFSARAFRGNIAKMSEACLRLGRERGYR